MTVDRAPLDEAVAVQREVVAATTAGSPERARQLNTLTNCLADLHAATSDRSVLDESVAVQCEAVEVTPDDSPERPRHLNNLANQLAELFAATGDRSVLAVAVGVQRKAVAVTPADSPDLPGHLNNLANLLGLVHLMTRGHAALNQAVEEQRKAVQAATTAGSPELLTYRNNLALRLADQHRATDDLAALDEAILVHREVVDATPDDSPQRARHLNNLALRLADLHAVTGSCATLDEAWDLVAAVQGAGPREQLMLGKTRAKLARLRNNPVAAATELEAAYGAFEEENARLRAEGDPVRLRDLAWQVDGLLGDLAATHIGNDDVRRALELLEGPRVWLRAPGQHGPTHTPEGPIAVAWVVPSQWETAVLTTTNTTEAPETFTKHTVAVTRHEFRAAVVDTLNALRRNDPDAIDRALTHLVDLTSHIVATFPQTSRLLVVPLGIAALLPYTAAPPLPAGPPLVEHTAVTLAPSLAWAAAAHRPRPAGRAHIAAFHSGIPPLDLTADRRQFTALVGPNIMDRPTARDLLAALQPNIDIGHFSCHGLYDNLKPLDSYLLLTTKLHLRAMLEHHDAPWLTNLSACETAIPDLEALEQHVSFPTGFLLGGSAHVFATLWPVGNQSATTLNGHIYQLLAQGIHPAEALRQAIQHLRHLPTPPPTPPAAAEAADKSLTEDHDQHPQRINRLEPTHPFRWAPFVHYGSPW